MPAGAMFLPPEVMISSFLRPVMDRKPSSSTAPRSPVEPAVDQGLRRLLRALVVALEDLGTPQQHLAVLGDFEIDLGQDRPEGAEAVLAGMVPGARAAALGKPPDLEDVDPDGGEELQHLAGDGSGSRDTEARLAEAHEMADVRQHQAVGQAVTKGQPTA